MSALLFAIEITAPIALVVILGIWFRKLNWIDEAFNRSAAKLVFNVALPSLLFVNIIQVDSGDAFDLNIVLFAMAFTVLAFAFLSWLSRIVTNVHDERGVFVQGSFRGNMGIIGLGFCFSAFGSEGATLASIYLAFLTLLYNVLAVLTLHRWAERSDGKGLVGSTVRGLMTNPLIIAILAAVFWRATGIIVPEFVIVTTGYLAQMTLPVALLSIGATLSWAGFRAAGRLTAYATALKLIVIPYAAAGIAYLLGFQGVELGVMYLMMATPTAAASYMMVRAMGGNASLAASIIAVSTVLSLFTTSLGLIVFKALQWI